MKNEQEILADFERYLKLKSVSTWPAYLVSLKEFFRYLEETGAAWWQVKPAQADEYRAQLLTGAKNLSRSTINNKLNRLRVFYEFLSRRRLIPSNPFAHTGSLHTGRSLPKNILSVSDMGKLLDNFSLKRTTDFMLKALVEILYGSALRIAEAEALKLEDVDFEAGVIRVTNFKENGKKWKCPAAEVSLRTLKNYLLTTRCKLLTAEEIEAGYIFPQAKGKTTLRCMLNNKLFAECRRLGLKRVTSHCFRHSCATHMLKSGAGIREVQALLAHERIKSTQRYTHVVKDDLKAVIATCHPRGGGTEP
jgi:site-specific recombinase XerD